MRSSFSLIDLNDISVATYKIIEPGITTNIDAGTSEKTVKKIRIPVKLMANLDFTSGRPVMGFKMTAKMISRRREESNTAAAAPSILKKKIRRK